MNSATKSRSDTASRVLSAMSRKPSLPAAVWPVDGKVVPASAPAPSGQTSVRLQQSREARRNPGAASRSRPAGDGRRHRLRPLQVGIAGHDRLRVFPGALHQRSGQAEQQVAQGFDLILEIEAQIGGHLVVAAAGGVQLLPRLADPLHQAGLDEGVDVLRPGVEPQRPLFNVVTDLLQSPDDFLRLVQADDPLAPQHPGVGDRPPDVLPPPPRIKREGVQKPSAFPAVSFANLPPQSLFKPGPPNQVTNELMSEELSLLVTHYSLLITLLVLQIREDFLV